MNASPHDPGRPNPAPGVGARAPSFRLRRTFDETVGLEELVAAGPVIVLFYVFDFGHV